MTTRRGLGLIELGTAGLVAGAVPLALAINTSSGGPPHRNVIAIFGPLIGWAFIGAGLFAWLRRPANHFGQLMVAVGFSFCAASLVVAKQPWLYATGLVLLPLPYAILSHMLLAFPTGRLRTSPERLIVWAGYLSATIGHWTAVVFQDTTRQGFPENPFLISAEPDLVTMLYRARFALGTVLLIGLGVILAHRWRSASVAQRRALAPVLVSAGLVMVLLGIWYIANLARLAEGTTRVLWEARVIALAVVPFAFLGGLLRSRVIQAGAVSRLMTQLGNEREHAAGLRDVLADALGDPSLTLAYWLSERHGYVDANGRPVELPRVGSGRVSTPVQRQGVPVAALIHDASLADEEELVRAVGAAASLALENARLDAELHAKLGELKASRARIVETGDAARRRIERDLHDGAQQRLVTVALTLRLARSRLAEEPWRTRELLDVANRDLEVALAELRELARGIHPAVLSERGLDTALRGLVHRAPVPVELTATPAGRLPAALESAAYFVVAEAITNVAKYAKASHAEVAVRADDREVVVEVSDDGVGGANPANGSGLRGLSDRVGALDGRLEVTSEPGRGTTIRATMPCG